MRESYPFTNLNRDNNFLIIRAPTLISLHFHLNIIIKTKRDNIITV